MIIRELYVKNFGKMNERSLSLKDGVNLITGGNESGKTTLHAFLHAMFYGLRRQRGRAAARDRYSRYLPWRNGGYYGGRMLFESGGKIFRLDRDFSREHPGAELVCVTDGERLSVEQGDLQMLLGNVGEAVFENTVSIGQLKTGPKESLLSALRSYMASYGESQAAGVDAQDALGRLSSLKKDLEKQSRKEQKETQARAEKLEDRCEYIRREMLRLQGEDLEDGKDGLGGLPSGKKRWKILLVLLAAAMALALAGAGTGKLLWPAAAGILLIGLLAAGGLLQRLRRAKKELNRLHRQQQKQRWEKERRRQILEEKERELKNLQDELEELQAAADGRNSLKMEIQAVDLAVRTISELTWKKHSFLGADLKRKMSVILQQITGGKYTGIHIGENFQIGIDALDAYVEPEQLSRGTVEQIYFAFRMAAGEILCQEEPLPFLLDDVFVMYDDRRLKQTLAWLANCGHQILLFTCHTREERLLKELGVSYHKISLEEETC